MTEDNFRWKDLLRFQAAVRLTNLVEVARPLGPYKRVSSAVGLGNFPYTRLKSNIIGRDGV